MKWQQERDTLAIAIKESQDINKKIYNNIDLIINFCNRLPDLYINASIENKQLILRTLIEEITYANGEIIVTLKPVFEKLRLIKSLENANCLSDKVRTLKHLKNQDITDNSTSKINTLIAKRVRTLKTCIIPNKKAPEGANFVTGASNGLNFEPYCVKLAHYSLHDEYSINTIKMLLQLE